MSSPSSDNAARPAGLSRLSSKTTLAASAFALIALPTASFAADVSPSSKSPASAASLPAAPATAKPTSTEPEVVKLDSLAVTEKVDAGSNSIEDAAKSLSQVSGATGLASAEDYSKGRVGTTADVLAYQPGIYAQETAGGDGIKLSVRGSAINRGAGNSYRSGIFIAFDGLPVTVPGGAPYELQEPLSFSRAEFLLGANGFEYGPRNFGGAINFVSPTGYDSSLFGVRAEVGSFGYVKGSVSSGGVNGNTDYYVSITSAHRQGFQTQSKLNTTRIASNFGWKISENVENRLYFRYGYTDHESPGGISKAQIKNDYDAASAASILNNSHREHPGTYWVGDKLTFRPTPDSSLEVGALYHNYPIHIYSAVFSDYHYDTASAQIKYKRSDDFGGHQSNSTFAAISSTNLNGYYNRYNNNPLSPTFGALQQTNDFTGSADNVILAQNDFGVTDKLWLTTGVSIVQTIRKNVERFGTYDNYRREDNDFGPRVGLRYDFTKDFQVYSNVSRTIEPRNDWAGSIAQPGGFRQLDLRNQTATTWEIGSRAKHGIFDGSLSFFHADIRNALLSVEAPIGSGITSESNASPTEHQGIEVGFNTLLWNAGGYDAASRENASQIVLRQTYTYSDYHYKNDPTYGKNTLPGVPEHYYQAELLYQHSSGFYAGVNAKKATSVYADYANNLSADGWLTFGAKFGYEVPSKKWNVYVDFRNITNQHYASSVNPTRDVNLPGIGGQNAAVFSPGDPFAVYSGFEYKF